MGRIRRAVARIASKLESLTIPRGELVPPLHLRWSYYRTSRRDGYRKFAVNAAMELTTRGLEPFHRVLDVGSGIGPLALGLIPHLTHGEYDGFDIHSEAVAWCTECITTKHPAFRFHHADLHNTAYNPNGKIQPKDYCFPFPDSSFHFAFLGSVFTHQPLDEIAHYLKELSRLLRPGGKCIISIYLLNDESRKGISEGKSFLPFTHDYGSEGSKVVDLANPALAIAHPEDTIHRYYSEAGLRIDDIRRGRWWDAFEHQQDVVTAIKM